MAKKCPIMTRMKNNYENRSKTSLIKRVPVVVRIDGKTFSTYTKGLDKPFDEGLISDMTETAKFLCSEIQGAKCAYVQSDEISILITDYDKLTSEGWFDYAVQKMTSVSAALATGKFNQLRAMRYVESHTSENVGNHPDRLFDIDQYIFHEEIADIPLAFFDSRVFNVPKEEVANYFLARQKDAVKNSISMLAQSFYSPKELNGVNSDQKQEMCFQKGINWNDLHFSKKRGTFITKNTYWDDELVNFVNGRKFTQTLIESNVDGTLLYQNPNKKITIDIGDVKVRTKWEAVETPMTFGNENFEQWI